MIGKAELDIGHTLQTIRNSEDFNKYRGDIDPLIIDLMEILWSFEKSKGFFGFFKKGKARNKLIDFLKDNQMSRCNAGNEDFLIKLFDYAQLKHQNDFLFPLIGHIGAKITDNSLRFKPENRFILLNWLLLPYQSTRYQFGQAAVVDRELLELLDNNFP
ncbi:MAG: hypothetical protein ACFFD4_29825, partial [Candidatus Odinarchaeota archaeon]